MITKDEIINILNKKLFYLQKQFHMKEIGLFGSWTRQEQNEKSDTDILVEIEKGYKDLFNFISLKEYLENLLNAEFDFVMKNGIKPRIREEIL